MVAMFCGSEWLACVITGGDRKLTLSTESSMGAMVAVVMGWWPLMVIGERWETL